MDERRTTPLERVHVLRGAAVSIALAVPTVLIVRAVKGGDLSGAESNVWLYAVGIVLVAFAVGGFAAATRCLDLPLTHSAVGAGAGYLAMAVGSGIAAVASGHHIHSGVVLGTVLLGALCVCTAVVGGYGAVWRDDRVRRRRQAGGGL